MKSRTSIPSRGGYCIYIRRPQRGLQACGIVVASLPLPVVLPQVFPGTPLVSPGDPRQPSRFLECVFSGNKKPLRGGS